MSCTQTDGSKGCSKVLTIAIPSYNVERYLEHGLASYCSPKLESGLEVIVVDDGSTDATALIAESFVKRSPSIFKVISKENGGHGSTINAALQQARGKYFRVVDGDDWVCTQGLIDLVERLGSLDCDLVVDKKREVHMVTGESTLFELPDGIIPGDVLSFSSVCGVHQVASQIMIHTLTAKTSYLRSTGLHLLEHTFYEDYEYILKASAPARDIVFYDIEVYQYLVGNAQQSVSFDNYVKRWGDHTRVVDEVLAYLERCEDGEVLESGTDSPLGAQALDYVRHKAHLIIDTHYNIALLFDGDRARGRARASAFRQGLRKRNPAQWKLGEKRYRTALLLNRLGISYTRMSNILGR